MTISVRIQSFFDKNEAGWEIFMIVLAIIFVAIGFLPESLEESIGTPALEGIDWGLTCFFALEFAVRIMVSPSKKKYFRDHWIDLVAIIPVVRWLRVARIARVLRLLRLARMIRVLNSLDKLGINLAKFGKMNGLQWAILAFTLIMLIASGLFYFFEHSVNDRVETYWDALYGSIVTWTTPGYGDIVPITTNGRICGLVLIVSGLVTWGILIANLAAFLAAKKSANSGIDPAIDKIQKRLSMLDEVSESELVALRGAFSAIIENKVKGKQGRPKSV